MNVFVDIPPLILKKKNRKFFTPQEDEILRQVVWRYGARNWILLSSMLPGKTARQCRDRYVNYLAPGLSHMEWSQQEDDLLKSLVEEYGQKWSLIAKKFPHRSPINVKNRWAHFLGKKYNSNSGEMNFLSSSSSTSSNEDCNVDIINEANANENNGTEKVPNADLGIFNISYLCNRNK